MVLEDITKERKFSKRAEFGRRGNLRDRRKEDEEGVEGGKAARGSGSNLWPQRRVQCPRCSCIASRASLLPAGRDRPAPRLRRRAVSSRLPAPRPAPPQASTLLTRGTESPVLFLLPRTERPRVTASCSRPGWLRGRSSAGSSWPWPRV